MNLSKQELQATTENLLYSLSNEYSVDYFIENFKTVSWINLSNKEKIIIDTIKKYKEHHSDFNELRVQPLIEYFLQIVKNDKVIYFEDSYIYKELYKILFLIDSTLDAQILLNDSCAYPSGFAEIQSDLKKVKSFRKHYQKNLFGIRKIVGKGQSRFRYWFTTLYIKNKPLSKFFTYILLSDNLKKFKIFNEDEKISELFLVELEFFLMQVTSVSKVVKSFGILLYFEMIEFLIVSKHDAEVFTKAIIHELFRESFNAEELDKVIEIKSALNFLPIFGASKKSTLKDDEREFIGKKLFEQVQEFYPISKEQFEPLFGSYIKTPHIQFLQKYPVELFRQNPKYSS
jgi:predicted acetyltransferase